MMATSDESMAVGAEPDEVESVAITAHRSAPDRTVFTEDGNSDGWIATDFTVDIPE